MSVVAAFQYHDQDTFLHRADPRAKLALSLSIILVLWIRVDLAIMLLVSLPLSLLIVASRLGADLKGAIRTYALLGLLLIPLNAILFTLYTPPSPAEGLSLPWLGPLPLTGEALTFSVTIYLRLVLMLLAASLFFLTTSPDALQALLLRLRMPTFFVLTLGFALRFLPTFALEAERIREAQMARGLDLDRGHVVRRAWRALVPLLLPLLSGALRRSVRFAEALEVRATFARPTRTSVTRLTLRATDGLVIGASVAGVVLAYVAFLAPLV